MGGGLEQGPSEPSSATASDGAVRYPRGSEEFGRLLSFTDGVVAIALTLIVLTIDLPRPSPGEAETTDLISIFVDMQDQLSAFVLSFVIIGFYWIHHHRFVASLTAITKSMLVWTLTFLLAVALMPLQAEVIGFYGGNPQATVIYAAGFVWFGVIGIAGYLIADRQGLVGPDRPRTWLRDNVLNVAVAPLVFLFSIPIAVFASPTLAALSWILIWPASAAMGRYTTTAS